MRRTLTGLVAAAVLAVGAVGGAAAEAHQGDAAVAAHSLAASQPVVADITGSGWRPSREGGGGSHNAVHTDWRPVDGVV